MIKYVFLFNKRILVYLLKSIITLKNKKVIRNERNRFNSCVRKKY